MTPILTKRQLEVAKLIASGKLSKQVAADLGISQHTAELSFQSQVGIIVAALLCPDLIVPMLAGLIVKVIV